MRSRTSRWAGCRSCGRGCSARITPSRRWTPTPGTWRASAKWSLTLPPETGPLASRPRLRSRSAACWSWTGSSWSLDGAGWDSDPFWRAPRSMRLSQGCAAVACKPGSADGRELTADQHRDAAVKLGQLWQRIGFEPFQDGVHLLDCHLQRTEDLLAEQQGSSWRCARPGGAITGRRCTVARSLPRQRPAMGRSRVMAVARGRVTSGASWDAWSGSNLRDAPRWTGHEAREAGSTTAPRCACPR